MNNNFKASDIELPKLKRQTALAFLIINGFSLPCLVLVYFLFKRSSSYFHFLLCRWFSVFQTMSIFLTLNKVLGVYALCVTILGTVLNLFNFYVCIRVRQNTTFVFLAFFALSNAFSLYWWNLNNFLKEFLNVDLLVFSLWTCKIGNYVQFTSLQMAAWFLVSIEIP